MKLCLKCGTRGYCCYPSHSTRKFVKVGYCRCGQLGFQPPTSNGFLWRFLVEDTTQEQK